MDPHSRLNQFNQRGPKSGPLPTSRFTSDTLHKPPLEMFSSMPPSSTSKSKKPGSKLFTSTPTLLVRRPIATNSRIKQNENYRKDMYLAFVNNALQQKLNVRTITILDYASSFLTFSCIREILNHLTNLYINSTQNVARTHRLQMSRPHSRPGLSLLPTLYPDWKGHTPAWLKPS
jgi:hypothetical protein